MGRGAVHPNSSNFKRWILPHVVFRTRRLVASGVLPAVPRWLQAAERAPPLDLHNLYVGSPVLRNPYGVLVRELLERFPDLRFQDCFKRGNHWAKGYDKYRDDHPAMQFAAQQLQFMHKGFSKNAAFEKTLSLFRAEKEHMERRAKQAASLATLKGATPLFGTAQAHYLSNVAERRLATLRKVFRAARRLRCAAERRRGPEGAGPAGPAAPGKGFWRLRSMVEIREREGRDIRAEGLKDDLLNRGAGGGVGDGAAGGGADGGAGGSGAVNAAGSAAGMDESVNDDSSGDAASGYDAALSFSALARLERLRHTQREICRHLDSPAGLSLGRALAALGPPLDAAGAAWLRAAAARRSDDDFEIDDRPPATLSVAEAADALFRANSAALRGAAGSGAHADRDSVPARRALVEAAARTALDSAVFAFRGRSAAPPADPGDDAFRLATLRLADAVTELLANDARWTDPAGE